jgi:hypothetical protein
MNNRLIFDFDVYVCLRLYCLFSSFDLFCLCEPTHGSLGGSCDSHSSICAARSFGAGPTASLTPPPSAPPFKAVPPSAVVESIKNYRQRWARQSYTSTKWITTRIKAHHAPLVRMKYMPAGSELGLTHGRLSDRVMGTSLTWPFVSLYAQLGNRTHTRIFVC